MFSPQSRVPEGRPGDLHRRTGDLGVMYRGHLAPNTPGALVPVLDADRYHCYPCSHGAFERTLDKQSVVARRSTNSLTSCPAPPAPSSTLSVDGKQGPEGFNGAESEH